MEPIKYITSSTTNIEVGMHFPTVESLNSEWDAKELRFTPQYKEFESGGRKCSEKVWNSTSDGLAYYRTKDTIDRVGDSTEPYTLREFKVRKINKSYDIYTTFCCFNAEHAQSKEKNNIFDSVYIGKQYAIDKNGNGFVDNGEIFTNDKDMENGLDRFF